MTVKHILTTIFDLIKLDKAAKEVAYLPTECIYLAVALPFLDFLDGEGAGDSSSVALAAFLLEAPSSVVPFVFFPSAADSFLTSPSSSSSSSPSSS